MLSKDAEKIIGGALSKPSKMPGPGFGIPAVACKTGSWLHKVPGSVCSDCYALKGRYVFKNVQDAQHKRLAALRHPQWVDAMVTLISKTKTQWFRWHDSGDIQDIEHLENIVAVARRMPKVKFWLPTREKGIVRAFWVQHGGFPKNLIVRVSAAMIDGPPPAGFKLTSQVVTQGATCPAPKQGNVCGSCRNCWNPRVRNVSYAYH